MTHAHETHSGYDEGVTVGFPSVMMLGFAAIVLAVVIAVAVLLAVRPWDNGGTSTTPNLPVPQQDGGGNTSDGSGAQ